jgi:hypothetical protein
MCNFKNQTDETKAIIHLFMVKAAENLGGVNHLLSLIEALRVKKPHPLIANSMKVASNDSILKWNKVVFKDKIELIENILVGYRESQESDFNLLSEKNQKKRKNIINMVKTLTPIKFVVTPQNQNEGAGFSFEVFDTVDFENEVVKFNPIFVAMFFCSTEFTKKALKYTI